MYSAVEYYCSLNIKTGGLHPFNTIVEYQWFASAFAYSKASPPTTTLSCNAKNVTYKDKTMHLNYWVAGLRCTFDDCMSLMKVLCCGKDFLLELSDDFIDNMTDTTYGYSWVAQVRGSYETLDGQYRWGFTLQARKQSDTGVGCSMATGMDENSWQIQSTLG